MTLPFDHTWLLYLSIALGLLWLVVMVLGIVASWDEGFELTTIEPGECPAAEMTD